jgi:serine protease Do
MNGNKSHVNAQVKIWYIPLLVLFLFFLVGTQLGASPVFEEEEEQQQQPVQQQSPQVDREIETVKQLPSFRDVAAEVLPVVVEVNVVKVIQQQMPQSPWDFFFGPGQQDQQQREFRRQGLGSGVIVKQDGETVYVITNHHVVGEADEINVRLADDREFDAKIVGSDPRTDLALLEFSTDQDVPVARLGNSDELKVGDWVMAVGNPYGFESTVTAGIVSALGRQAAAGTAIAGFTDFIQTDASINPGNSGGPLVNLDGEVVGINTWIASRTGGSVGIGFAIPVDITTKVINDIIETGKVQYGWLGVGIDDIKENQYPGLQEALEVKDKSGVMVINVFQGSPADKDGILPGDYITRIDDTNIQDAHHLTQKVGGMKAGSEVEFTLFRYGEEKTVTVELEERPTEQKINETTNLWPGMAVLELTDQMRGRLDIPNRVDGVVVGGITPQAGPSVAGFKVGDVITEVNEQSIDNAMDFYKRINTADEGEVMFKVVRGGSVLLLGLMKR